MPRCASCRNIVKSNVFEGFISGARLFWPVSYAEQPHSRRSE